jgi:ABC-type antimicrobial peptide transport system permease subunit
MAISGVGVGVAGAAAVSGLLSTLLFGPSPFDLVAYVSVSVFLIFVALLAVWLLARQAANVDPMITLWRR